jgi:hypothetical protein
VSRPLYREDILQRAPSGLHGSAIHHGEPAADTSATWMRHVPPDGRGKDGTRRVVARWLRLGLEGWDGIRTYLAWKEWLDLALEVEHDEVVGCRGGVRGC